MGFVRVEVQILAYSASHSYSAELAVIFFYFSIPVAIFGRRDFYCQVNYAGYPHDLGVLWVIIVQVGSVSVKVL